MGYDNPVLTSIFSRNGYLNGKEGQVVDSIKAPELSVRF